MSNIAYRDEQRKDIIYSSQSLKEDKNKAFYCPNPKCNARLYICAIDGSQSAYFRATKSKYPHIPNCIYGKSGIEFDKEQFDESKFHFDDAIENLCSLTSPSSTSKESSNRGIGESQKTPPRTLRQIYSMCKSISLEKQYGDKKIGEMILDDRTENMNLEKPLGKRIIEAAANQYLYDKKHGQIYLTVTIGNEKFLFVLEFFNDAIYKLYRDRIYNNRDKIIVVAAEWRGPGIDNSFIGTIFGKKQLAII